MKHSFLKLGFILFANIGFSQFVTTGTATMNNLWSGGNVGIGYTTVPNFSSGGNRLMVTGGNVYFSNRLGIGTSLPSEVLQLSSGNAKIDSGRLILGTVANYNDSGMNWGVKSDKPFIIANSTFPVLEIRSTVPNGFGFLDLAIAPIDYGFSNFSKKGDVVLRGYTGGSMVFDCQGGGNIKFVTVADPANETTIYNTTKVQMLITKTGKVGIGTGESVLPTTAGGVNISGYKLFVTGGILTEEVRVSLANTWADYVFNNEYQLKPLAEVEDFIKKYGHLPNVPSAARVKEEGLELGNIAVIQQEKIEELTLYIIEQNKVNEKQSKEIEELKELVNKLINKQ